MLRVMNITVLKGMKKILKKNFPIILIEIEKRHNKNYIQVKFSRQNWIQNIFY